MLTTGMPVEVSMNWPVLLNESCPMKLMIYGCVIRSNRRARRWRSNGTSFAPREGRSKGNGRPPVEFRLPS